MLYLVSDLSELRDWRWIFSTLRRRISGCGWLVLGFSVDCDMVVEIACLEV